MSEIHPSSKPGTLIFLGVGILSVLAGLAAFAESTPFATAFLGARFLFGSPASNVDWLKLLFVQGCGVLAIVQGAVLLLVGLFQLAHNGAVQEAAVKPVGR